jgi:hypothetical protein
MNISDFHRKNFKNIKTNLKISDFQKNLKNRKNLKISDFQKKTEKNKKKSENFRFSEKI